MDGDFATDIQGAAEKFSEEIEKLKEAMAEMFGDWETQGGDVEEGGKWKRKLGDKEDLCALENEAVRVQDEVHQTTRQFKVW